jgi:DNA-binding NtrC family response regulator
MVIAQPGGGVISRLWPAPPVAAILATGGAVVTDDELPDENATERLDGGTRFAVSRGALLVVEGERQGQSFTLDLRKFVLGSGRTAHASLPDRGVSKRHAELELIGGAYLLRDLGSTNGTFLNGTLIREAFLSPGDLVMVGTCKLRFEPKLEEVRIPPSDSPRFGPLFAQSLAMRQVFGILERVAPTESTVLIQGESGTGKDLLAQSVHQASTRARGAFQVLDCSAVSPDVAPSELFGHEAGAFTGASRAHQGVFEAAHGGTVFLDEIGELSMDLQPKLLRVLEAREVRPVGSNRRIPVDVRIVAASHRNLLDMVRKGQFREDLYFRLAVVTLQLPPLRQRKEDIPGLVEILVRGLRRTGDAPQFSDDALTFLKAHSWPGNVRELRNVLERSLALCTGNSVEATDLMMTVTSDPAESGSAGLAGKTLREIESEVIRKTLELTGGNQKETARILDINRETLRRKVLAYGLKR